MPSEYFGFFYFFAPIAILQKFFVKGVRFPHYIWHIAKLAIQGVEPYPEKLGCGN